MFKRFVLKKLQKYVRKYFEKHPEVKLVVVVGSVGKTSTKRALATIASQRYRVRMHEGNHNTAFSVPLAILGVEYPTAVHSPIAWLAVFRAAAQRIKQPTDVDVIIQELGTDRPGDIQAFGAYLVPDLALVTAVTPEHMEFFGTIDAVAQEELTVSQYAKFTLINRDDVEGRFAAFENNPNFSTYGITNAAEYHLEQRAFTIDDGYRAAVYAPEFPQIFEVLVRVYGEHSLRPIIGAIAGAAKIGMAPSEIVSGVALVSPVPGRMNLLRGMNGTTIIDDTYNSSPAAASAALQTLYSLGVENVPQRIAVFGDMRELGNSSQIEHEKIGALCDPNMLAWVVTVGPESEKHLAPVARQRGCQVHVAPNAIAAGEFVRSVTEEGAMILVKGSEKTIYLEECVKILCDMSENAELVRQSEQWMRIKNDYFSRYK